MPLISVIVPYVLDENRDYLASCLESLRRQSLLDFECVVYSMAPTPPELPPHDTRFKLVTTEKTPYATTINRAVAHTDPRSQYLLLAQDDLIFSKNALLHLTKTAGNFGIILNPMSNCDNAWLYNTDIVMDGRAVPRFFRKEEIPGIEESAMAYDPQHPFILRARWLCFYCTLIPRGVWSMVGALNESYRNGYEDRDYCFRAKKHGVTCHVALSAFVLHFGGLTSEKIVESHDRESNKALFRAAWGNAEDDD